MKSWPQGTRQGEGMEASCAKNKLPNGGLRKGHNFPGQHNKNKTRTRGLPSSGGDKRLGCLPAVASGIILSPMMSSTEVDVSSLVFL